MFVTFLLGLSLGVNIGFITLGVLTASRDPKDDDLEDLTTLDDILMDPYKRKEDTKMPQYAELDKLEEYLKSNGYEYERRRRFTDGYDKILKSDGGDQIVVYKNHVRQWDAIFGLGSYGYEDGLLEVMGYPVVTEEDGDDGICGFLTAQGVIERLEAAKNAPAAEGENNAVV